jgi:hypothetical protein
MSRLEGILPGLTVSVLFLNQAGGFNLTSDKPRITVAHESLLIFTAPVLPSPFNPIVRILS